MSNPSEYTEERIKPGVRRLVAPPKAKAPPGEIEKMQALLAKMETGPTQNLLALIIKRLSVIEEG